MEEEVLLELTFYGKMKFKKYGQINWFAIIQLTAFLGCIFLVPRLIDFLTPRDQQWYSYIPAILVLIGGIVIKVSKALIEKQNRLKITTVGIYFSNLKEGIYKTIDFSNVFWFDYTVKEVEDGCIKELSIVSDNEAEYFNLDKLQEKQIEKLINKLKDLNLDVRFHDY